MKIITRPTVSLFSKQDFVPVEGFPIPDDGDDPTKIGSFSAKVCYRSFGEAGRSNTANQENVISSGHGKILEHMVFGLHVTGISRALSLEIMTHSVGISKSQESTRYTDKIEDAGYVLEPYLASLWEKYDARLIAVQYGRQEVEVNEPSEGRADRGELDLLGTVVNSAMLDFAAYERQVGLLTELNPFGLTGTELRKWARGKARNSLPHGLETRMVLTGNLRAWRHFLTIRSERHAEDEMRRLAEAVFKTLQPLAPLYFEDFGVTEVVRGISELQPKYRKV